MRYKLAMHAEWGYEADRQRKKRIQAAIHQAVCGSGQLDLSIIKAE
jgi:hypothetical protein